MGSARLSSGIVEQQLISSLAEIFVRMESLNMNFWEQDRYRFIVIHHSVHLGDTLLVSRGKVATGT